MAVDWGNKMKAEACEIALPSITHKTSAARPAFVWCVPSLAGHLDHESEWQTVLDLDAFDGPIP